MIGKRLFSVLLLAGSMAACTTTGTTTGNLDNSGARSGYGTVESVQTMDRSSPGVLGAIGGAVVGGLLGHQIGSGSGQTAATIAGAAGGAYAGREIERRAQSGPEAYKIFVRMDDGTYQAVAQENQTSLRTGDRVRVENGVVSPY